MDGILGPKKSVAVFSFGMRASGVGRHFEALPEALVLTRLPLRRRRVRGDPASDEEEDDGDWLHRNAAIEGNANWMVCAHDVNDKNRNQHVFPHSPVGRATRPCYAALRTRGVCARAVW